jgi:hypothetical protein
VNSAAAGGRKSSLTEQRVVSAAQLTATKMRSLRGPRSWIARATSSLPVPVSPSTRTVVDIACRDHVQTRPDARVRIARAGVDPTTPVDGERLRLAGVRKDVFLRAARPLVSPRGAPPIKTMRAFSPLRAGSARFARRSSESAVFASRG